jgi:hypothetical protein
VEGGKRERIFDGGWREGEVAARYEEIYGFPSSLKKIKLLGTEANFFKKEG